MMSYKQITSKNRNELSALLRAGLKQKDIAGILGKDPSSISREIKRNKTKRCYHAGIAKQRTKKRRIKANQRFRKIENNKWLQNYIKQKLKLYWSPEQIAGRLKVDYGETIITHPVIYEYVHLKIPKFKKYLRCKKGKYRRRYGTRIREKIRENGKKRSIDTRPEIVEQRITIGHWEGDTVVGKRGEKDAILTYTERKSGYLKASKLPNRTADEILRASKERLNKLPRYKRQTLTFDNGVEFADYELIERDVKITIYFAHPYHSWERGTNENTNGLLRQFFPKKQSFKDITQRDILRAERLINNRPRKRLNYLTPKEVFTD